MNKRIISSLLTLFMVFSLAACGSSNTEPGDSSNTAPDADSEQNAETQPEETAKNASWEVGETEDILFISDFSEPQIRIWFPIKNTGTTNLNLRTSEVVFDDATNEYISEEAFRSAKGAPEIIAPGETGVYSAAVSCSFEIPKDHEYTFTINPDIQQTDEEQQRFEVSDIKISDYADYDGALEISGTVSSIPEDFNGSIRLVIVMFNSDNQFIGHAGKIISEGFENGKVDFTTYTGFHLKMSAEDVDHFEAYAYQEQY